MEWSGVFTTMVIGLVVRFGIPLVVILLMIWGLKKLDDRWQQEAQAQLAFLPMAKNEGCWIVNNCSEEKKSTCRAYANQNQPCFQVFRTKAGELQERCLGCQVFREAALPVTI